MSKHTLLPSCIFPPVPWMAAFLQYENCLIEIHETFAKQTFRNRMDILTAEGKTSLTVPVSKPNGNRSKTMEIMVSDHQHWQRQQLATIESAYGSSPYFDFFSDKIEDFFHQKHNSLIEMNDASVKCLLSILRIEKHIHHTKEFTPPNHAESRHNDLRYLLSPKQHGFYEFSAPPYYQLFKGSTQFLSNLSVLDLVFNTGLESVQYLKHYPIEKFIVSLQKHC